MCVCVKYAGNICAPTSQTLTSMARFCHSATFAFCVMCQQVHVGVRGSVYVCLWYVCVSRMLQMLLGSAARLTSNAVLIAHRPHYNLILCIYLPSPLPLQFMHTNLHTHTYHMRTPRTGLARGASGRSSCSRPASQPRSQQVIGWGE